MDSGNSGSMQSSSGGDEEYDSRAESISIFLNNPLTHVGPPPPPQPQPPHHHNFHHQTRQPSSSSSSASMFDPLSNYFDPLSSSSSRSPPHFTNPTNSLLNLDMVNWTKNLRSDTNSPDLTGFIASSSPTHQFIRPTFQIPQGQGLGSISGSVSASGSGSGSGLNNIDQTNNTGSSNANGGGVGGVNHVRNPKKRSRASRRAPTTVLTTDTTNFRAMVQEFTGIPAPPFTSSPFPRSRLDLFGNSSTFRSSVNSTHFDSPSPPPPYLLRPFAHKIQPPLTSASTSFSNATNTTISSTPSSMVDAIVSTTTNVNSASATNTNPDHLGLFNPILSFHPLFQPSAPKFPLSANSSDSHLKIGGFEDFGLSHGGGPVNANLSGLVPSSSASDHTATLLRRGENNWEGDHQEGLLRSINGSSNYNNSQRIADNGKANYSASAAADFHGDKGTENVVATRTEGMMESWICSSD